MDPRLLAKIRALSSYYRKLGSQKDLLELIKLIRRPGWTTPAERLFAHAMLDSLTASAAGAVSARKALMQAARSVGK